MLVEWTYHLIFLVFRKLTFLPPSLHSFLLSLLPIQYSRADCPITTNITFETLCLILISKVIVILGFQVCLKWYFLREAFSSSRRLHSIFSFSITALIILHCNCSWALISNLMVLCEFKKDISFSRLCAFIGWKTQLNTQAWDLYDVDDGHELVHGPLSLSLSAFHTGH